RHARPGRVGHDHAGRHPRDAVRPRGRRPARVHGRRPDRRAGRARRRARSAARGADAALPAAFAPARPDPRRAVPHRPGRRLTMKRLGLMLALAGAVVASVFAAGGAAASHGGVAKLPKLPALPADVASRHRWAIGVKCDFSPFGYIDAQGNHAGYDVEVAQRFATLAFGRPNRISMTCVNTASRIPTLISGRVDAIVSTLTWTPARADQIAFSIPYYSATGRLLVPNDSSITKLSDIAGKTVVTTRGAIYDTWMHNCFRSTKVLEVDGTADAVLAVKQGRADAFMFDD